MSLAEITKQLARHTVGESVNEAIDALRPSDAAAVAVPESLAAMIAGQVQAMQNALKEDQELMVLCTAGLETLRVFEFFTPSPRLIVLTGIDSAKTVTRMISPAEMLQLVCKPMPVQAGAKPVRIRFVSPKPKSE